MSEKCESYLKKQARRWQLTYNEFKDEKEFDNLHKRLEGARLDDVADEFKERFRFYMWCTETAPKTGKFHVHIYTECRNPITGGGMQKLLGGKPHLEICRGSQKDNIDYIKKHGQCWTRGTPCKHDRFSQLVETIQSGSDIKELTETFSREVIMNRNAVIDTIDMFKKNSRLEAYFEKLEKIVPYPWQQWVIDECGKEADDRHIIWISDIQGAGGKSTLVKLLARKYGTDDVLVITGGKTADTAEAWNGQNIIIFHYTRTLEAVVNYNAIEQLKDGFIFSSKYKSKTKMYAPPHVVCFANFEPNFGALTGDRWIHKKLVNKDFVVDQMPQTHVRLPAFTEEKTDLTTVKPS